jgi:uncharacterized membrane protein YcaP (DUF421 family)
MARTLLPLAGMENLVQLSAPWWEFIVRAVLVYVVLLLLMRLSGKRTVGEFTPFDLIVVILLGESMQGALSPDDTSVLGPAIVAATLVALNWTLGFLTSRSRRLDALIEGEPVVLARNGRLDQQALRSQNVPRSDVMEAIRRANLDGLSAVGRATLETDGEITIVPRKKK